MHSCKCHPSHIHVPRNRWQSEHTIRRIECLRLSRKAIPDCIETLMRTSKRISKRFCNSAYISTVNFWQFFNVGNNFRKFYTIGDLDWRIQQRYQPPFGYKATIRNHTTTKCRRDLIKLNFENNIITTNREQHWIIYELKFTTEKNGKLQLLLLVKLKYTWNTSLIHQVHQDTSRSCTIQLFPRTQETSQRSSSATSSNNKLKINIIGHIESYYISQNKSWNHHTQDFRNCAAR